MLYVFHVDTGTMKTFDMSLTTESVQHLKENVEAAFKIPPDRQVLLISGGECLDSAKKVCSYSSGTDTNPIYLFSRSIIESPAPPPLSVEFKEEYELIDQIRECLADLPPSYTTVAKRALLAQRFSELAAIILRACESLVQDQHRQHQGWAAVVANLEDVIAEFRYQATQLECDFTQYIQERQYYIHFLEKFSGDLNLLRRIPILSKLMPKIDKESTSENETMLQDPSISTTDITLLDWIGRDDNDDSLETMFEKCRVGLQEYDETVFRELFSDISNVLENADNNNMKEIRGLGHRLYGLEQLMATTKQVVQEQTDLATSVTKNQSRVRNLKDASILPDLCSSHRKQLCVMADNHKQICDIRRRCTKAKEELSINLYHRLQWVMYIQNMMLEIGDRIEVLSENIGKLRYHLSILEQVHLAPAAYLSGIAEIVRRRNFSQAFLVWASEVACRLLTIHNEEVTRRKDFQSKFEGHFVHGLFPGMDDRPPDFATQAPSIFDSGLPKLTVEDIEMLKAALPDLAEYLNAIDEVELPDFLLYKSIVKTESEKMQEEQNAEKAFRSAINHIEMVDNMVQKDLNDEVVLPVLAHGNPHLKDLDKGCESETDTEEFEKVGQSPLELHFDKDIPSPKPGTQDASTATEGTLEISKSEYDRVKTLLGRMGNLAAQTIVQLKLELEDLKVQFFAEKTTLLDQIKQLNNTWGSFLLEREKREKILLRRISTDHISEINDFRKLAQVKNDEIKSLRTENAFLESKIKRINEDNDKLKTEVERIQNESLASQSELEKRISNLEIEKDRALKEVTERLNREHRDEISIIRARFKLMTMERSPSEGSLEKIERGEFSSLTNHETIISQLTENFEIEKEQAVKETVTKESEKWERVIEKLRAEFEAEKHEMIRSIAANIDKERDVQIEEFREREKIFNEEINTYRNTIDKLTHSEMETTNKELMFRIEELECEKASLDLQLQRLKREKQDLAASVLTLPEGDKTDAATSPIKLRKSMTKSESMITKTSKLNTESLKAGDSIVIVWDEEHESFRVMQVSESLYFLHSDCIESLGLKIIDGKPKTPNKHFCFGEYITRDFCHARKSENRYKVPKGTRFFRVHAKPLGNKLVTQSCILKPEVLRGTNKIRRISEPSSDVEYQTIASSPKMEQMQNPVEISYSQSVVGIGHLFLQSSSGDAALRINSRDDKIEEEEELPFSSAVSIQMEHPSTRLSKENIDNR